MLTAISFVVVLSLLVFVHELGHFVMAKRAGVKVEEFGFGYPLPNGLLTITLFKRGETVYTLNPIPFGGFVRMAGEEDPNAERGLASKSKLARVGVLSAGSVMNILLGIVFFTLCFMLGWPEAVEFNNAMIESVASGSPAEQAGLKVGDIVIRADDEYIDNPDELVAYTRIKLDQEMLLVVKREGKILQIHVTPRLDSEGISRIGVVIMPAVTKIGLKTYPFGEAILQGLKQTVSVITFTFYIPVLVIRGLLSIEMARPIGPVGIAQLASQAVQQSVETGWWFPVLNLMALLSTGLAVANLLPLPGLDGGRIFFVIVEAIRGKRVDPEKEGAIHLIGLAILVTLLIFITYRDITTPVYTVDWTSMF
ncbi:MAG TPA: PDZ domain-containing protein [Anaerolineae bacterium]|nr:PDZ domain-containing protein [Anaerolineae bacterium]